jgi:MFS family permease
MRKERCQMNNNIDPEQLESLHPVGKYHGAPSAGAIDGQVYSKTYIGYVLFILFLAMTLSFADRQLVNILLEPIKQEFGASDTEMGLLTGLAFVLFYATMSIPLARLADRRSRRNILVIAMAVWSAMTAFCGMSTNFIQLALSRFGVGIGEAGGGPASYSMVADYVSPRRRNSALAILSAGAPVGILLSMYGGAVLSTHYGWRVAFLALGIPGVLLSLLIYLTVREPLRGRWDPPKAAAPELSMREVLLTLWREPAMRTVALATGVTAISGFASGAWMPSFFMRVHGFSLVEAGMVLGRGSAGRSYGAAPSQLATEGGGARHVVVDSEPGSSVVVAWAGNRRRIDDIAAGGHAGADRRVFHRLHAGAVRDIGPEPR